MFISQILQGTEVLVSYLRSILKTGNFSTLESVHMILITIDCVTCCVVGCFANEDYFLENEGIFLLLDFIEVCYIHFFEEI